MQLFPAAENRYQVTTPAIGWLRWRDDGRELAMIAGGGRELLIAEVEAGANLWIAPPHRLMSLPLHLSLNITRDFKRVVIIAY